MGYSGAGTPETPKKAKTAIAHGDIDFLLAHIDMATTFPVAELRIKLGKKARTWIFVLEKQLCDRNVYNLDISSAEFDRIRKSTSSYFEFQTNGGLEETP